jgi:aspartate/methionine/tyrosine aminotransferase
MNMPVRNETNEHYRRLAFELGDGDRGRMLSGWQCENPFVSDLLLEVRSRSDAVDFREYTYFDADEALADKLVGLHRRLDGLAPPAVLAGAGASPLIATFIASLADTGVKEVHYIPPLYHTLPTGLDRYGIKLTPVAHSHTYEPGFALDLPTSPSVLLLTDPVWYAGVAVPTQVLQQIRQWQDQTGSTVFVDGSLQYLPWGEDRSEASALLSPEHTYRLISACKQLAINGFRFAHLLLPKNAVDRLAWTYANLCGPASAESVVFAHAAVAAVADGAVSRALTNRASARYEALVRSGIVEPGPRPDCGYYAFVRHTSDTSDEPSMDGRYFDQPRYPGFTKLNLLSPAFGRFLGANAAGDAAVPS